MNKTEKSLKHKVFYKGGNKQKWFQVESCSGEVYDVFFKISCTCRYQSVQGIPNGNNHCSHILAVLKEVLRNDGRLNQRTNTKNCSRPKSS